MPITSIVDNATSQVLDAVQSGRDETVKALTSWTETVEGALPEALAEHELIERLPKPVELVEAAFDLAQKIVEYQVDLARSVAGTVGSVVEGETQAA